MGWFLTRANFRTRSALIQDLMRFPELRFLDRFDILAPVALAALLFFGGTALAEAYPQLGTSGAAAVVWGFFVSTVVLYHATFTINSLAHRFGRRRYATSDDTATTRGSRCSRSAKAGTTTTTTFRAPRARASTGGRSTSPTTACALLAALGIDLGSEDRAGRAAHGACHGARMKIAIVGSGIAGNVAARHLHREHDITVFEAADHVGGHTHTHSVELEGAMPRSRHRLHRLQRLDLSALHRAARRARRRDRSRAR